MAQFDDDKEIKRVLVLIAMEAEARPLLDSLQLAKVAVNVPFAVFEVYQGDYKGTLLTVVTNGKDTRFNVDNVGTTPGMFFSSKKITSYNILVALLVTLSLFINIL